jgi:hypothetical protein
MSMQARTNVLYCFDVDSEGGMWQYFRAYSSAAGLILSTVLTGSWDSALNYSNATPTAGQCERVLSLRDGFRLTVSYLPGTQVFQSPLSFFAVLGSPPLSIDRDSLISESAEAPLLIDPPLTETTGEASPSGLITVALFAVLVAVGLASGAYALA